MPHALLVTIVSTAVAASAAEAPFSMGFAGALFGSAEVGGVDEVDTYPGGLPEAEPEVVSPPFRPGESIIPPPRYDVRYRPLPPQPPPVLPPFRPPTPTGELRYRTALSAEHTWKGLHGVSAERDQYEAKFLFKRTTWDGVLPFDRFEEQNGVGYFAIRVTPPGSGWYEYSSVEGEQDGIELGAKLYLADELTAEGSAGGLWSHEILGGFDEVMFSTRAGMHMKNGLSLWYGWERHGLNTEFVDWGHEWTLYGADWFFSARNQHFKIGFLRSDVPDLYFPLPPDMYSYGFMGPFERTRMEFSWFPTKKFRLSSGFKIYPEDGENSRFASAKWDASRSISLEFYREESDGPSKLRLTSLRATLRF